MTLLATALTYLAECISHALVVCLPRLGFGLKSGLDDICTCGPNIIKQLMIDTSDSLPAGVVRYAAGIPLQRTTVSHNPANAVSRSRLRPLGTDEQTDPVTHAMAAAESVSRNDSCLPL